MSPQDLENIYAEMGIDTSTLGCMMLDTENIVVSDIIEEDTLFFSKDPRKFWINGIVCEWKNPHVTLLCGLMESAQNWKSYIDVLLSEVDIPTVTIERVSYFDSNYDTEDYYCIIAEVQKSEELITANNLLKKLPHISSFPEYVPHITLAYIKKDPDALEPILSQLTDKFINKKIKTTRMNYGE